MNTKAIAPARWERIFLWLFLGSRIVLLIKEWGVARGFDVAMHLEMVTALSWKAPAVAVRSSFYAYHPPFGFLLARIAHIAGLDALRSVQLVSFAAMLIAFFVLRSFLRQTKILHTFEGIFFLYGCFAIPMSVFLAYSVNLDAIVFACAVAVLRSSIVLLWSQHKKDRKHQFEECCFLFTALVFALFTKFSGILLFGIPPLVFFVGLVRRRKMRYIGVTAAALSLSVALIFPYYYLRYYVPEGTFFPSNTEWVDAAGQAAAHKSVEEDPVGFIVKLLSPTPVHDGPEGRAARDLQHPRLTDTWKDFWMQDLWMGKQSAAARYLGAFYYYAMAAAVIAGILLFFLRPRKKSLFGDIGLVLLFFGGCSLFTLSYYTFQHPWGGCVPTKAIYIAPILLTIAYFLTVAFSTVKSPQMRDNMLVILAFFMVLHAVLPVY